MTDHPDIAALRFEQAYQQLESIVEQLGSGDLPLDESLQLFERGQALAAHCQQLLDSAELKVQQLTPDTGALNDFAPDAL